MNALRVAFRNEPLPESVAGIPRAEIEKLAQTLKDSRFGIIFFGMGLTMTRGKHRNVDIAISLTVFTDKPKLESRSDSHARKV